MLQLIRIFLNICRLKAGPQDLPKGLSLLIIVILAGIILDSLTTPIFLPKLSVIDIIKVVVIYNIILLTAIYLLFKLIGYTERVTQTITAVVGAGIFISLVLLPALLMMNSIDEQMKSISLFILIDNVWRIVVNAHIFRHALSVSFLMAMILSVSYLLFGALVADSLLPVQTN